MTCLLDYDPELKKDEGEWLRADEESFPSEDSYSTGHEDKRTSMEQWSVPRSVVKLPARTHNGPSDSQELSEVIRDLNLFADVFQLLINQWKDRTAFLSSERDILDDPACQRIVQFGAKMLPQILSNLAESPDPRWFGVLASITGESPISKNDRGKLKESVEAWLEWGRQHHYL